MQLAKVVWFPAVTTKLWARRINARLFLPLGAVLLAAAAVHGQVVDGRDFDSRVQSYLRSYAEAGDFSGVVLVARDGRLLSFRSYGMADRAAARRNVPSTAFRTASLSKTFTAAAVAILVERGSLHLDDPISRFFPDFPNGSQITAQQLLLHRSGVGELDNPELAKGCVDLAEMVRRIGKLPVFFAPGSEDRYSNEGYVLLAAIIEQRSGMSYAKFLQKNLLQPLGMKHTGTMCTEWPVRDHAVGSIAGLGNGVEPLPFNEAGWDGPGSVYSNAKDLYIWLQAMNSNKLFRFSALPYPFGWGKRNYSGKPSIEQSGQLEGYTAFISFYPEQKAYIVFLNNIESGLFSRVAKDMDALLWGGNVSSPPKVSPVAASAAELSRYAGSYLTKDYPVPLNFEVRGASLFLHWGDGPFLRPLVNTGRDQFFERAEYGSFAFKRDAYGKISHLTAKWEGNDAIEFEPKHK
jgi:CubicO group peptidase (beta-lactamase class C family)